MSREDQVAQKSVTSLTRPRSSSFHSAADAARGSAENAPIAPARLDVERNARRFICAQYNDASVVYELAEPGKIEGHSNGPATPVGPVSPVNRCPPVSPAAGRRAWRLE